MCEPGLCSAEEEPNNSDPKLEERTDPDKNSDRMEGLYWLHEVE